MGRFWIYGDFAVISNSPELFFRVGADRRIVTGRSRGRGPMAAGMEKELRRFD